MTQLARLLSGNIGCFIAVCSIMETLLCVVICNTASIINYFYYQSYALRDLSFLPGGSHLFVVASRQFLSGPLFACVTKILPAPQTDAPSSR